MKYMLGLNSEEIENQDKLLEIFEGVGMIRGENLCMNRLQYFSNEDFREYVKKYLDKISKQFKDKPVWYRTADLVPHQINTLEGADEIFNEEQFLIGTRGVRRNLRCKETFLNELKCFVDVAKNNSNLGIIIPFVSRIEEMQVVINILRNKYQYNGKIGMMLEIPSTIIRLDEFNELGIDNYTLGMNDLTTLVLGADREKKEYYSMSDKAVLNLVRYATEKVHSYGKEITVAGYLDLDFVKKCEEIGIDNCNIHYNLIPSVFKDIENPEEYPKHYNNMKERYKKRKRTVQENGYDVVYEKSGAR